MVAKEVGSDEVVTCRPAFRARCGSDIASGSRIPPAFPQPLNYCLKFPDGHVGHVGVAQLAKLAQ
jgi:hypothetical protein